MNENVDLRTIRFYLENARAQLRNVYSKHGTNGKDAIQQAIEESLKELKKLEPVRSTQEVPVQAG